MNRKLIAAFIIAALMLGTCSFSTFIPNTVVGSGNVASENRSLSGFSSVTVEDSANLDVTLGPSESVTIQAEDNILPLIETRVQNGQLVIGTKSYTGISTRRPVHVMVTMKVLKSVTLRGSGNIEVSQMAGEHLVVNLPGSGNITVTGTAANLNVNLSGSGNVYCEELKAKSARVTLNGSGEVEVFADQNLDARMRGSGTIRYSGNPAQVSKNITGSGSITP